MLGGLSQPGTLISGPEKPSPGPTLPVSEPAEATVRAKGERSRTLLPAGRSTQPLQLAPRPPQAGQGRLGPAGCYPSWVHPVWEFAMILP